jgi:hypothetical protein
MQFDTHNSTRLADHWTDRLESQRRDMLGDLRTICEDDDPAAARAAERVMVLLFHITSLYDTGSVEEHVEEVVGAICGEDAGVSIDRGDEAETGRLRIELSEGAIGDLMDLGNVLNRLRREVAAALVIYGHRLELDLKVKQ